MDDVRISEWSLQASAGTTVELEFTSANALTSLSLYTGGTVTDVDDLTDATEHAGVLSGGNLVATVDLAVPTGSSVPLRLVVNGVVQSVGRLHPSTRGVDAPDNTITLNAGTNSFDLTILGVIQGEGGGAGSDDQTAAEVPFTPTGSVTATNVQDAVTEVSGDVTTEATARAAADTALDTRVDALEAVDPLTQAEGDLRYHQLTTDLASQAELDSHADDLTLHTSGQRLARSSHGSPITITATASGTALPDLASITPADSGGRPITVSLRARRVVPTNANAHVNLQILRDDVVIAHWTETAPNIANGFLNCTIDIDDDPTAGAVVYSVDAWVSAGTVWVGGSALSPIELVAYAR